MEDFRISNYLARQVGSYGQERAEEGAALSPDGGDNGALADGSYHFEDEQEAAQQELAAEAADDAANEEEKSQDDDTAQVAISKLERMRVLGEPEEAESAILRQRGRHYYRQAPQWHEPISLPALEPKRETES